MVLAGRTSLGFTLLLVFITGNQGQRQAPTVTLTPKDFAGVTRGFVYMICNVTGSPMPTLTWYKNGSVIRNSRIQIFTMPYGGLIRIGPLRAKIHKATYECEADNGVGPPLRDSSTLIVHTASTKPAGFPRIAKHPSFKQRRSGDDVTFTCAAVGTPTPNITWFKDRLPIVLNDPRVSVLSDGRKLRITDLRESDNGKYSCVARNALGMVFSSQAMPARLFIVVVRSKPEFTLRPQDKTVDPDTDVELKCSARGSPTPSIVWEVDGSRISGQNGELIIRGIQRSGNYSCIADSNMGRVQAYAYVTVRLLPFAPSRPNAASITSDAIKITWHPRGAHVVTSYEVQYRLKGKTEWQEITNVRGMQSLVVSGLRPFSSYEFRVFAVNSLGRSRPSLMAEYTTSETKPGSAPRNIEAMGVSDTSFKAGWLPPISANGRIRGYRLYYSLDLLEDISQWRFMASSTNSTTVTGLTRQTTHFFRILAYNIAGDGPLSEVVAVKTQKGVPGQPRSVQLSVLSSTAIRVTWSPPRYPGDGIFGYDVYYNKSKQDMDTVIGAFQMNTKEIMGLTPYTVYKVAVAAKSDKGVGPMSFVLTARTDEDRPSDAPQNIQGRSRDSTTLEISWDPPRPEHRNGLITHFTIKYRAKGQRGAKYLTVDATKTSVVLHNLDKFTNYFIWVQASTKQGDGPFSDKHTVSTAEDVPNGAPRDVRIRVHNSTTMTVKWNPPTTKQDGKILGYMVFYTRVDDQGNQLRPPAQPESKDSMSEENHKVHLTGLAPETTYQIEVAAYTIKGDGARSVTRLAKTMAQSPDPPFVYLERASGDPISDVTLAWRTSATGVIEYKVRYAKSVRRLRGRDQGNLKMKEIKFKSHTTKQKFQSLANGIWYLFNVSLRTKAGWSPETSRWIEIPPGPPSGPPLNVRAVAVSSTSVEVTWSAPDIWNRGGPILGYSVMYNPANKRGDVTVKNVTSPNIFKVVLKRLKKFREYEVRVRAIGMLGMGPASEPFIDRTKEDVPSQPLNVGAVAQGSSTIRVTWHRPRHPNGIITGYTVIYTTNPKLNKNQWSAKRALGRSTSLEGLSRGTEYWIRVAGTTDPILGIGDYSKVISVKTLMYDLPGECRDVRPRTVGSDWVILEWLPPRIDAGIVSYKISYYGSKSFKQNGKDTPLTHADEVRVDALTADVQTFKVQGLVPHMKYTVSLSASNAMGEGPRAELSISTKKGKPPALAKPTMLRDEMNNGLIPVELHRASEKNGPISYYLVVVVPLDKDGKYPQGSNPDEYFKKVRRSAREAGQVKPYIAAKFLADQLPKKFLVGDEGFKNQYGYYNKRLVANSYYTVFSRAYVQTDDGDFVYTSSPFTDPVLITPPSAAGLSGGGKGGLNLAYVIIPVVLLLVIVTVIVLAVLYVMRMRRRRRSKKESKCKDEEKSEPSDPVEMRRLNFQTPAMIDHPPISVLDLPKHIAILKADNNSQFTQEYESIEPGQTFTADSSQMECNKGKNRYPNIHAYDHSRVRLSYINGIEGSDYINANFCDGYRKERAYIATQGPMQHTAADFWRMVWEQRTFTIVMLTREEERGRVKCDQYWPTDGTDVYEGIEVSLVDWVELANYTISTLQICKEGASQPREVKHFQFTGWPDHGVPAHPTPFLAFLRRVKFYNPPDAGPIVVHCSAGVGRTGCFIVIDSMLERLRHEETVDIYGHVTVLRTQRNYMVQTQEQYIFSHDAILEAVSCGNTEVHARNLLHHIKKLTELGKGEVTGLEEEFKSLVDPSQAKKHKYGAATLAINRPKNRLANILPYETTRVHISPVRGVEGSDYINASFIDGYRQRGLFIATQGPLQDTVDDFWRMLMEQNSNIIVMLTQLHEGEWEKCYKYWPTDRSARHQYYIVDPIAEHEYPQFVIRDFKVKDARSDTVRNIKQFHFLGWPETGVPKSGEGIIDLIGQVQRAYEQQEEEGPITVHCSDGVGRTGVFTALFIVLERMRSEGVVDLFQTVKLLRTQRPAMVQSQEQYLFCYKTALEYLGSFDHYAI
ncbi:tyrosine-protein phosphatase Lar isoform X2 [Nematostella vectensis]|uniref:tyrosine-protein phosphatase Lar isoform X2 n=1 Tax=Nematostella vectensis TaxID=45351 RepID=UPI002077082E|nr:tyrosine-protein phosphatase Lar isoform X2 [Nematostella vectensis]